MIDVMETGMVIEDEVMIADTEIMEEVPHVEALRVELPQDGVVAANLTTIHPVTEEVEEVSHLSREGAKGVVEELSLTLTKEE